MNSKILFILPYAGGSFYSMKGLVNHLKQIDSLTLELSGRGKRINEPLSTNLDAVVNDLYSKICKEINNYNEYYIFGHSMGSLLGYLLAHKLKNSNLNQPKHLFVSGRGGPAMENDHENTHLLLKKDFWEEIKDMGGLPSEILKNEDLMLFFEPILRSDFEVINQYKYEPNDKLDVPITAFFGSNEHIEMENKLLWQNETNKSLDISEFEGNHFYIFNNWVALANSIMNKIESGD